MSPAELNSDVVVLACAISAGIHGALVPGHFAEGAGPGLGFAAATVTLAALAVWFTWRPASLPAPAIAAVTFASLLVSYALATTTGVPVLHPNPEPVDGLALATKAVELAGLLAASHLVWRGRPAVARSHLQPKGSVS